MRHAADILLTFFCIGALLIAGCVGTGTPNKASVPTPPSTPSVLSTTVATIQTTESTVSTITTSPPTIPSNPTPSAVKDPILHRYFKINTAPLGYEITFYPNGVVNYRVGSLKMVSSDYTIDNIDWTASGTWTSLGNNKYMIQILPAGQTGAQIIREYTLIPAHSDPQFPGLTIAEHIESSYESNTLNKAEHMLIDQMYKYYPQRAKND